MLGWAIKKGLQGVTGVTGVSNASPDAEDTAQLEGPDTPAPIFAARAIRNAVWGASEQGDITKPAEDAKKEPVTSTNVSINEVKNDNAQPNEFRSPTKLNSILLTPGTGTARRKRVSFDHDTKASTTLEPSPFEINKTGGGRRNTALQQALENSRKNKKLTAPSPPEKQAETPEILSEDWQDDGEVEVCNHDVTVDLNEPHSGSGKYWKGEFDRYHEDAKAEMTALVKYKHLAKSYAKQKDAESTQLSRRLKEEQDKVAELEKKLKSAGLSSIDNRRNSSDREESALAKELIKQSALVVEYRDRIRELEATFRDKTADLGSGRRQTNASPQDEKALLEVNRELRRAKSELRDMDNIRKENEKLKAALEAARVEAARDSEPNAVENTAETQRTRKLETQLREVKEELRNEKTELRKIKREFEILKRDAKSRTVEAMQVLQEKNAKIRELEDELQMVAAKKLDSSQRESNLDQALATHSRLTRGLRSDMESLNRPGLDSRNGRTERQRSMSVEDLTVGYTAPRHATAGRSVSDDYDEPKGDTGISTTRTITRRKVSAEKAPEEDGAKPYAGSYVRRTVTDRHNAGTTRILSDANDSPSKSNRLSSQENATSRYSRAEALKRASMPEITSDANYQRKPYRFSQAKPVDDKTNFQMRQLVAVDNDTGIDLLQDRFARLGSGDTEKLSTGNVSRCALPPDRLAAARARLQQKKMARIGSGGSARMQELEKENFEPQLA